MGYNLRVYATRDWKRFEDISSRMKFPDDHRHGTAVTIPEELAIRLQARQP